MLIGNRGVITLIKLYKDVDYHYSVLKKAVDLKKQLEHKNKLLQEKSLNLDLLDEQTRNVLGYVDKNEIVIILNPQ
ncbi:septum formation initiator [Neoehrlichia mikurensis]|uniref:Septum formation initiator n=1 Tax=Neoehrlichia mikurensis TaxID=89586 RepID=A0A9Q9BSW8_9RICK|nr:septum formation initiator [Neoehrlichia mikurensis]QXK91950.1 septum formation initiator [Neoehrlichia mikurensis]QXK93163.1 septum formation initiator [Neoehrlichia mikurensis]QXK93642.1 septum formation initiator [Neoehrlichia mikurensis]UTO55402.1 septum formation initiator [Neoehrlichia mikurensis]UTO56321.1 septum formation initiator [Neoehrlichia mikurensis]